MSGSTSSIQTNNRKGEELLIELGNEQSYYNAYVYANR